MKDWWEDEGSESIEKAILPPIKTYSIDLVDIDTTREFTNAEKCLLRPIAETLALLDGNAFLSHILPDGREWYEMYLHEAYAVVKANGGKNGWIQTASWVKDQNHENTNVKQAYESWRTIKTLSRE